MLSSWLLYFKVKVIMRAKEEKEEKIIQPSVHLRLSKLCVPILYYPLTITVLYLRAVEKSVIKYWKAWMFLNRLHTKLFNKFSLFNIELNWRSYIHWHRHWSLARGRDEWRRRLINFKTMVNNLGYKFIWSFIHIKFSRIHFVAVNDNKSIVAMDNGHT